MDDESLYPMRMVTRLTGLTADTIRAWERRHRAIRPSRSAGNTRRFSGEEVRRLKLLREATERGHAISRIAALGLEDLERLVAAEPVPAVEATIGALEDGQPNLVKSYLDAIHRFDTRRSSDLLLRAATFLERRKFVFGVALPIVEEVGRRWHEGEMRVGQEHLVSTQLLGVLSALLRMSPPNSGASQVLISTPSGHRHEFGALLAGLLAATRGLDVVYLGPDLPYDDLRWAVRMSRARILALSIVKDLEPGEGEALAPVLGELSERIQLWVGLPLGHALVGQAKGPRWFHRLEDFDAALSDLS